jgi:superfamily II RNA helicase
MRDIKDRAVQTSMAEIDGKLCVLKDVTHAYNHGHVEKLHNIEKYMRLHHIQVKRHYVLNRVGSMLKERTMLPAICFVFSRRSAEEWAEEIEAGLFNEEDEREKTYPSIVEREAREILRKMPNYREYLSLPEFHRMMRLLQKGIAVHHSGVLPVLREMIELLFARGFIKLLFATETFAVGVNMPTKTVMFTALSKFDGRASFRNLASHEYTQMAGRAGRRGLDTIGHVIHLNNLFEVPEHTAYQLMLSGRPQTFESRFRIDCGLVMRVASQVETAVDPDTSGNSVKTLLTTETIADFIRRSTLSKEITQQREEYIAEAAKLTAQLTDIQMALLSCGLSETDMEAYADLLQQLELVNRRKRDRVQAQIDEFRGRYERDDPTMKLEDVFQLYKKKNTIVEQLRVVDSHIAAVASYVESVIGKILAVLEEGGYIEKQEGGFSITRLGRVASKIQEIPGMAVAKLVEAGTLNISARELSAVLSIFTEVRVKDEDSIESWRGVECVETPSLLEAIEHQLYQTEEMEIGLNMQYDVERYKCQYNIYDAIYRWCSAETEEDTRAILAELEKYGIFAGEFVKAILKIQNIVRELTEVAEMTENLQLKETLAKVPSLLLKFIATNQSLYV